MPDYQEALFGDGALVDDDRPRADEVRSQRVLITVKAAPNPSRNYGETVCVAGLRFDDLGNRAWIRLYPINFRHLQSGAKFDKYDVVTIDCRPARQDARQESWRPIMESLVKIDHLPAWKRRRPFVDSVIEDDMCALRKAAGADAHASSLALVRPTEIASFVIEKHPGWTPDEQGKIDAYVNQLDLFDETDKTPLEAPAYRGVYHWRCASRTCGGHKQSIIDWEFVALQRHLRDRTEPEIREALHQRWFDEVCAPDRDVAFYVGNQAKRHQTFSILGVYWPRMTD